MITLFPFLLLLHLSFSLKTHACIFMKFHLYKQYHSRFMNLTKFRNCKLLVIYLFWAPTLVLTQLAPGNRTNSGVRQVLFKLK